MTKIFNKKNKDKMFNLFGQKKAAAPTPPQPSRQPPNKPPPPIPSANNQQQQQMQLIYPSLTICPICAFKEKKELKWISGEVVQYQGKIWFVIKYVFIHLRNFHAFMLQNASASPWIWLTNMLIFFQ